MSDNTFYAAFVKDMFKEGPSSRHDKRDYEEFYGELHAAVGLAGEAGEVLDVIKKVVFVGKPYNRDDLIKELGDVEFYLQALRNTTGITRDDILVENIRKLEARHPDGFKNSTFYKEDQ